MPVDAKPGPSSSTAAAFTRYFRFDRDSQRLSNRYTGVFTTMAKQATALNGIIVPAV